MELIDEPERAAFRAVLSRHGLAVTEFELRDEDTTDPKTDEVFGQQGVVTVTRRRTGVSREYPIGLETEWETLFERDLAAGVFG